MQGPVLLASNNPGKVREFLSLLEPVGASLVTPRDLGLRLDVAEDGATYAQNAARKLLAYRQARALTVLADDSGLEVEALEGAPGLHSARFSRQPAATDADRQNLLLARLQSFPRPWRARFCCVVVVAGPTGPLHFAEGFCYGEIIPQARGRGGFGYDPIFLWSEIGKTMAELDGATKNRLSHRARAVAAILPALAGLLDPPRVPPSDTTGAGSRGSAPRPES